MNLKYFNQRNREINFVFKGKIYYMMIVIIMNNFNLV
jgi:hypothetical protein